jgi:hypothetical protein
MNHPGSGSLHPDSWKLKPGKPKRGQFFFKIRPKFIPNFYSKEGLSS